MNLSLKGADFICSGQRFLISGCQFKLYEAAPHGLIFTHVDRLNADLLAFVQS